MVTSGQVFRWHQTEPGVWAGVDGDHHYRVQVQPEGLSVQSNASQADFERFLRWDEPWDMGAFLAGLDPSLESAVADLPGFRMLRPSGVVETLFCFLCTSNNHLNRIGQMVRWLGSCGEPFSESPEQRRFPSLARIAQLSEGELRAAGFGYRGATIPLVAQQVRARGGLEWLELLKLGPREQAVDELRQLPGIGPKLADCIALYALHYTDSVPVDTHLWQGACRLYFPNFEGQGLTAKRYQEIGELFRRKFGIYAGHAHLFVYFHHMIQSRRKSFP